MEILRQSPRVAVNKRARVALLHGSGEADKCTLLDVSAEGAAVKVSSPEVDPEPGDFLTIYMDAGTQWIDISGRVRYVVTTGINTVVIGIELDLQSSGAATQQSWTFWVDNLVASEPSLARH